MIVIAIVLVMLKLKVKKKFKILNYLDNHLNHLLIFKNDFIISKIIKEYKYF